MTQSHSGCDERVAIVIPCFNAQLTLAATLASALAQDVAVDIVVIDDGSRDRTLAVAREFEPHIRVISGPNRGVSAARNTGIVETNAPWIVFLDADDLLEPGTLAKRLACAEASDADVVICDWMDLEDDGAGNLTEGARHSVDWSALEANSEVATATHVWATTAAIVYHRNIVDRIGGFRSDLPYYSRRSISFRCRLPRRTFWTVGSYWRAVPNFARQPVAPGSGALLSRYPAERSADREALAGEGHAGS